MKNLLIIFLFILTNGSNIKIKFNKLPNEGNVDIKMIFYPVIRVTTYFGLPFFSINVCLDWESPYTWVKKEEYNTYISEYFMYDTKTKGELIIYDDTLSSGYSVYDVISFKKEIVKDPKKEDDKYVMKIIKFFLGTQYIEMQHCSGVIGLRFNHINKLYQTFTQQVKENNVTSVNEFSIVYTNNEEGYLIFDNSINTNEYLFKCDIVDDKALSQWYSRIYSLELNGNNILKSPLSLVKIQSSFGLVMGPSKLKEKVINGLIENFEKHCIEYTTLTSDIQSDQFYISKDYEYYLCTNDIEREDMNELVFYFNTERRERNTIRVSKEDVFTVYNSTHKLFNIAFDNSPGIKLHDWIIGDIILRKYRVNYNVDELSISFYSKGNATTHGFSSFFIIIGVIILILLVLSLFYYARRRYLLLKRTNKKRILNRDMEIITSPLL